MSQLDDLGIAVETADGSWTMRHPEHGECYHSAAGALQEARDLYVRASGLQECLQEGLQPTSPAGRLRINVLDIGLGLGYNAAATIAAWWDAPRPANVELASLECNRALFEQLRQGIGSWQRSWPELWHRWLQSLRFEGGVWLADIAHPYHSCRLRWTIYLGDASTGLPAALAQRRWQFFWQDPFSPAKNPPLWNVGWFGELAKLSAPGAILMTYSVARPVREALAAAGWQVSKIPTSGHKRAWLRGQWPL